MYSWLEGLVDCAIQSKMEAGLLCAFGAGLAGSVSTVSLPGYECEVSLSVPDLLEIYAP